MKIYTRTGDDGTTSLIGGARVSKSSLRVECYGSVDALQVEIGAARLACTQMQNPKVQRLALTLKAIEKNLFMLGAQLAAPGENKPCPPAATIESEIDCLQDTNQLPPLTQFVLPGDNLAEIQLHRCRVDTRRLERLVVALHEQEPDADLLPAIHYINRLSDYFFICARIASVYGD